MFTIACKTRELFCVLDIAIERSEKLEPLLGAGKGDVSRPFQDNELSEWIPSGVFGALYGLLDFLYPDLDWGAAGFE